MSQSNAELTIMPQIKELLSSDVRALCLYIQSQIENIRIGSRPHIFLTGYGVRGNEKPGIMKRF